MPPSNHLIFNEELFFSVAEKSKVTEEDGGHPSGIYSGVHILINTWPALHSTALG